jgi:O-antigen/teichoic acid export membrane protein
MTAVSRKAVLRNTGFNLVGALVPLAVTLVTVPIYLSYIGAARYGVVLVAWSLLGYFGFLDFGISRATTNALAKLIGDEHSAKERVFWSSLLINGGLGLVGGLLFYALGSLLFLDVMKIAPDVRGEALASMPYIAAMLPAALMLGVGVGTAEAHERFGILNVIQTTGLVLGQVLPLLAVLQWGTSLTIIMPVMLAVRGATFVAVTLYAMRSAGIAWKPVVDFGVLKQLLSFGGWVTVTNLVGPIMTDVDQFVIGAVRSVSLVPFYAVPLNIVNRTLIIPNTLMRTLFPVFSRLEKHEGDDLMAVTLGHLMTIMTLVYCGGILLGAPFLRLWIGTEMMAQGGPVFRMLCIGAFANSLGYLLFGVLQGQGRPRVVAVIHTAEVLPYVALMWFMVHHYGIFGSAIAWTIRMIVDTVLLGWAAGLDRRIFYMLAPSVGCLVVCYVFASMAGPALWPGAVALPVIAAVFLGVTAIVNPSFRDLLRLLRAKVRELRPANGSTRLERN